MRAPEDDRLAQLGFDFGGHAVAESPVAPTALSQAAASGLALVSAIPHAGAPVLPATSDEAVRDRPARGRAATRARTAVLFSRLQGLGLRGIEALVLMRTRTVMVSLIGRTLRVHEGYADAPDEVLRAIVTFATARNKSVRTAARDRILAHDVERAPAPRRAERARPGDLALVAGLVSAHRELNARWFGGTLTDVAIRISGRMASRLGHYDPGSRLTPPEIALSRVHVTRHGWRETMHTLLHEMVHQWQHETEQPIDHGAGFRKKCREVGITPAARRDVVPIVRRMRGRG